MEESITNKTLKKNLEKHILSAKINILYLGRLLTFKPVLKKSIGVWDNAKLNYAKMYVDTKYCLDNLLKAKNLDLDDDKNYEFGLSNITKIMNISQKLKDDDELINHVFDINIKYADCVKQYKIDNNINIILNDRY